MGADGSCFSYTHCKSAIHAWLDFGQSSVPKSHRQTVRRRRSGTKASATEIIAEKPQNIVDTSPYAPKGLSQQCIALLDWASQPVQTAHLHMYNIQQEEEEKTDLNEIFQTFWILKEYLIFLDMQNIKYNSWCDFWMHI